MKKPLTRCFFALCVALALGGCSQFLNPDTAEDAKTETTAKALTVAPSNVTAIGGRASMELSWSAVADASGYRVFYKAGAVAAITDSPVDASMVSGTSASVTGLADGSQYAFVVVAVNSAGSGPASAVVAATTDAVTGSAIQASALLPVTPGLSSEYTFYTNGPSAGDSGKKWLTLQNPQPDARLFYTFTSENGGMTGTGRYYNWVNGFYFAPYRFITGVSTKDRSLLDLLALQTTVTPGSSYTFKNVSYSASLAARDGKTNLVRISFDSSGGDDSEYKGKGYYLLEPGVGVYRMEFRSASTGAFGPAGTFFSYQLNGQTTVTEKTVTGRVLDSASAPLATSYVTVNSHSGTSDANFISVKCDSSGAFSLRLFAPDASPLMLYAGVDVNGDFAFDGKTLKMVSPPIGWVSDALDIGTIVFSPSAPSAPVLPPLPSDAADLATYESRGLSLVPGPLVFPTGLDDKGTATAGPFWIGQTEVTHELWAAVYAWARTDAGNGKRVDGGPLYSFACMGQQGSDTSISTKYHPVTMISWRDAIVWCNALTERFGSGLDCVYYADSACTIPLRSSDSAGYQYSLNPLAGSSDKPYVKVGAKGFRLPLNAEWELAARYISDANADGDILDVGEFYPGTYSSGATGPMMTNPEATNAVAVSWFNSNGHTAPVKSKKANALGLFDMNGNVWELCFDTATDAAKRFMRGQCWGSAPNYESSGFQLAGWSYASTFEASSVIGFRVARSK